MKSNFNPEYLLEVRRIYGSWLRTLREEKSLTQDQLGDLCGISRSSISKIEAGKWNFSIDFLTVILQKLNAYIFIIEKESEDPLAKIMYEKWNKAHKN